MFITRAKESARKARGKRECCFFDFSFSLFEPITRASRWPPFAAGYVNERLTKDKTNPVRGLLQGNPQVILQSLGNGDGEPCALLVFPRKKDHRRPNSSARRDRGVFCLHVCACVFQACVGRRVASARKARGLKCANGGAQKPRLLTRPSRSLYVSHLPWWA